MKTSKKKTLWIISELFYPELTSTGYYLTEIAKGLTPDANVNVVCSQPNYAAKGLKAPANETYEGVRIRRVISTLLNKNYPILKVFNMLTFGVSVFAYCLFNFRAGHTVLVVTTPPNIPFIVAVVSLIKGTGYFLLIHDNYPEILIAAGLIKENSLVSRFLTFVNRWVYKHASGIIVVGRDMREMLELKTAGLDVPITCIPNWAELESVCPGPRDENEIIQDLGLERKLILLYAGNMGPPNDLETIIKAAERLVDENAVHFIFLGGGSKRRWLERVVKEKGLENVTLLQPSPRANQRLFLNACDIGIVSLVKGMRGVSVPSRTYNLMSAGKPLLAIAEEGSEIDLLVKENKIGLTVPPDSPEAFESAVRYILEHRGELQKMGFRSRSTAIENLSFEKALLLYRRALRLERI